MQDSSAALEAVMGATGPDQDIDEAAVGAQNEMHLMLAHQVPSMIYFLELNF